MNARAIERPAEPRALQNENEFRAVRRPSDLADGTRRIAVGCFCIRPWVGTLSSVFTACIESGRCVPRDDVSHHRSRGGDLCSIAAFSSSTSQTRQRSR